MRLYYLFLSIIMALWEIEIEGIAGWASNLPTKKFMIQNRVVWTNYHTYFALFTFLMFHQVFLFQDWDFPTERKILSEYSKFFIIEDTLWFALNCKWKKLDQKNQLDWWREPKILDGIPVFYFPVLFLSYLLNPQYWFFNIGIDFVVVMALELVV